MQQKLQTILFFTFLICVQITYTNSLKIKSLLKTHISTTNATNTTVAENTNSTEAKPQHNQTSSKAHKKRRHHNRNRRHRNQKKREDEIKQRAKEALLNKDNKTVVVPPVPHRNQYILHHEVPNNLTALNNRVRAKIDKVHTDLDNMADLRKENEERKLIQKLPTKPEGIDSIAVLNIKLGHISKQTQSFKIESIADFAAAFKKAQLKKQRKVKVNGMTYYVKKVGMNFYYGAIANHGGIGIYQKKEYLLVVVHNDKMTLNQFGLYFEKLKKEFENAKPELKVVYNKDHIQQREDYLKKKLKHDKHLYDQQK